MKQVKIGIIGLGARGVVLLPSIALISGVEIAAVCDAYPERVERYLELCKKHGYTPAIATGDYKKVLEQDLDAVIVSTTWTTHVQIAVDAMRAGKHVGLEVGGATCEQDCWRLVETSQETGKFCMMLENCCYGDSELTVFNMVQQGLFGEIVHATGGYEHDLREQIVTGGERKHGRMVNFLHRNGELYPTHQLGPIAKLMGINRGNRIVSVISAASKARGLHDWARRNRPGTDLAEADWKEGDVVTTILICANGETIVLTHGCSLPRPYSRDGRVQGTLGWRTRMRSIWRRMYRRTARIQMANTNGLPWRNTKNNIAIHCGKSMRPKALKNADTTIWTIWFCAHSSRACGRGTRPLMCMIQPCGWL